MTFASPLFLALLPVIPLGLLVWWFGMRRGIQRLAAFSRQPTAGPPVGAAVIFGFAAAAAVVSAAGPRLGERDAFLPRRGADLFVVLDVSRSMAAADVEPSRLDAAKAGVETMLKRLGGDRAGLVVFAGDARVRFPLTADLDAAARIVRGLEPAPVLVGAGTSARSGVDVALEAFDPESESGRILLLITDGDDLGPDPVGTAERIAASDVDFLVLGVGTEDGAPVPIVDPASGATSTLTRADGTPVITSLNAPFLRALATAAGGTYLGSDPTFLASVVPGRLASLNRVTFDERERSVPIDRSQWFAAAAILLAVAATAAERIRPRRRHVAAALSVAAALFLSGCAAAAYDYNEQALDAYTRGDFNRAAELFVEAQAERPGDPALTLNLAAALHADGRFEEAATAARRALSSPSARWRNRAHASVGHHRFALGDLPGALDSFKQALIEDPEDETSRRDFEVVLRMLTPAPQTPPGGNDPGESDEPSVSQPGEGGEPGTPDDPGAQPSDNPGGQPGGQPGQGGTPPAGADPGEATTPLTDEEAEERLDQIDAEVGRLIEEAGETPTAAQALEILRLLAERTRISGLRDSRGGDVDPADY